MTFDMCFTIPPLQNANYLSNVFRDEKYDISVHKWMAKTRNWLIYDIILHCYGYNTHFYWNQKENIGPNYFIPEHLCAVMFQISP